MGVAQEVILAQISLLLILLINLGFTLSNSTEKSDDKDKFPHFKKHIPISEKCAAFFKEYSKYAGEFSHCELAYAEPFRICENCIEQYAIMSSIYNDLVTNQDLDKCRIKYMKSDRVQIIPTVQKNMEDIWTESACSDCYKNLSVDPSTKKVSYDLPVDMIHFLKLYDALSVCMNTSIQDLNTAHPSPDVPVDVCVACLKNYTDLNNLYNKMSDKLDGNVCMDIVDRMNYTRLIWSHHYNCSCFSSEPAPIIAIAFIVASSPLFFYLTLRLTGKQTKKKVVKQKRLNPSMRRSTSGSFGQTLWRPRHYQDYHSLRST